MRRVGAVRALLVGLALVMLTTALGSGAAAAAPTPREQAVKFVIARGLSQRGVPFVWGGGDIYGPTMGKAEGGDEAAPVLGFDASGLMQYVFAGVSAKLPRSSGAMYKVGKRVTPAQALPADLLFYGPDGSESVAMFLGDNQMLEVGDTGVAVSPVRTSGMAPYLVRIIA